jgi:hypothetical protein
MSYEDRLLDKIDQKRENILLDDARINRLHEKSQRQKEIYAPNMDDFADVHKPEFLEKEKKIVAKLEEKWGADEDKDSIRAKKMADIFETSVVDELSGEWFGNLGEAHYTSKADDYIRGVDAVFEFSSEDLDASDEQKYLGLGIDVTFSSEVSPLQDKLHRNFKKIEKGQRTDVKYFEKEGEYKGPLKVFSVIVAAEGDDVKTILEAKSFSKRESIDGHKFQYHLIAQIKTQLEYYYLYFRDVKKDQDMAYLAADTLRKFYKIYEAKEEGIAKYQREIENSFLFKKINNFWADKI